jgi:uncharacterized protein (DUF305 family)
MSKTKTIFAACLSITLATGAASAQRRQPNYEPIARAMSARHAKHAAGMHEPDAEHERHKQHGHGAGIHARWRNDRRQPNDDPARTCAQNTAVMNKMHADMAKDASIANPDEAISRAMIPHHQAP